MLKIFAKKSLAYLKKVLLRFGFENILVMCFLSTIQYVFKNINFN